MPEIADRDSWNNWLKFNWHTVRSNQMSQKFYKKFLQLKKSAADTTKKDGEIQIFEAKFLCDGWELCDGIWCARLSLLSSTIMFCEPLHNSLWLAKDQVPKFRHPFYFGFPCLFGCRNFLQNFSEGVAHLIWPHGKSADLTCKNCRIPTQFCENFWVIPGSGNFENLATSPLLDS